MMTAECAPIINQLEIPPFIAQFVKRHAAKMHQANGGCGMKTMNIQLSGPHCQ